MGWYNHSLLRHCYRGHCRCTEEQGEESQSGKIRRYRIIPHSTLPELFWRSVDVEWLLYHLYWCILQCLAVDYCRSGIYRHSLCNVQRCPPTRVASRRDLRERPRIQGIHPKDTIDNSFYTDIQRSQTLMAASITTE